MEETLQRCRGDGAGEVNVSGLDSPCQTRLGEFRGWLRANHLYLLYFW